MKDGLAIFVFRIVFTHVEKKIFKHCFIQIDQYYTIAFFSYGFCDFWSWK